MDGISNPYMQIAGGLGETLFGLLGGFGSKPKVAQFHPINYGSEQTNAIQGNLSALQGPLSALGNAYTQYSLDALNKLLPGYSDTLAAGEKGTNQLLNLSQQFMSGNIPQDVIDQIQRSDAFQSLSGGYAGSQMGRNLTARDLGLTSIDLMQTGASMLGQGGNSAQQWERMASQSVFDPTSMMVTPQQRASFDLQNALLKLGTRQEQFNVNAQPDPTMAGLMAISGQFAGGGMGGFGGLGGGTAFNSPGGSSYSGPNADIFGFG